MLKALKRLAIILVAVVALVVVYVMLRADRTWQAPYPEIAASSDSIMIARGRHLALGPAHCVDCHSPASASESERFTGGNVFVLPIGTVTTPNITPDPSTGIGRYSDGEIARTLRYGIKPNGEALMDFMPFYDLSDRDVAAIISYLRSLDPVRVDRPVPQWNFMGKAVRAFGLIRPMGDGDVPGAPPEDSTAAYGKYLAESVANCRGCHTQRDLRTGAYVGPEYAGQMLFDTTTPDGRSGWYVTPNLTPDPETGRITLWTEDTFVARFHAGVGQPGSPMPWNRFSTMSDTELKAIYRFLHSLEPIRAEKEIPVGLQETNPYEED